jgi:hypothetical protein
MASHNDYLANVMGIAEFKRNKARYPYLLDEEVAPVENAFDAVFDTIKTRETDTRDRDVFQREPAMRSRADSYRKDELEQYARQLIAMPRTSRN